METDLIISDIFSNLLTVKFLPLTIGHVDFSFGIDCTCCVFLPCYQALRWLFFSLTPKDIQEIEALKNKNSRKILKHLKNPEQLLATILIGNNFVNVGIVILSAYITSSLVLFEENDWIKYFIEVFGITAIILFFGEILPKVYASKFSKKFAEVMAYPIMLIKGVFSPLSFVLVSHYWFCQQKDRKKIGINISG